MMASLLVLARESSGDKRRELLRSMASLFIDKEQDYSDRELVLFGEVIGDLLDQVDLEGRIELSRKIATTDRATGDLHLRLAEDEIAVAATVLRDCILFDDETLADIASRQSQDHLDAIAKRAALSARVTDVLVDRGEPRVVCSVTRNLGAELSKGTFDRIIDKAADDAELQSAVSYRADMPLASAARALKMLPPRHRDRLAALMAEDSGAEDSGAETGPVGKADAAARTLKVAQSKHRLQTEAIVAQIRDGHLDLDSVIMRLARENRYQNLARVLGEVARLKPRAVLNALFQVDHAAIVALLKSLGATEPAVSAIAQARARRLKLPASMADRMVEAWRETDDAKGTTTPTPTRLRAAG
ncbi:DUF2336 domain-containing protein [Microbaculum sp. FT89]|uniref:DUF2336 domain-containing protein n=1 Tax=Microbaculum sp. FT89 TaxID=3447298 RepID=UPI003F536961